MLNGLKRTLRVLIFLFSGLYVFSTGLMAYAGPISCKVFLAPNHQFEFVDPRLFHENHKLGEGNFGKVYLHKDSQGGFYVQKIYKNGGQGLNSQINGDLRAFRYLKKYAAGFSFNLPNIIQVSDHELKMSYHPGRTVADLLADSKVSFGVKTKIKFRYEDMVRSLVEVMRASDFEIHEKSDSEVSWVTAENDSFTMGSVHFIIKPDNVIADPESLKLTLIDPY